MSNIASYKENMAYAKLGAFAFGHRTVFPKHALLSIHHPKNIPRISHMFSSRHNWGTTASQHQCAHPECPGVCLPSALIPLDAVFVTIKQPQQKSTHMRLLYIMKKGEGGGCGSRAKFWTTLKIEPVTVPQKNAPSRPDSSEMKNEYFSVDTVPRSGACRGARGGCRSGQSRLVVCCRQPFHARLA